MTLTLSPEKSQDGVARISWEPTEDAPLVAGQAIEVELQQSMVADFSAARLVYRGTDGSSILTGMPDGVRFLRVRALAVNGTAGPWSEPQRLEVEHHPLSRAFGFFAVGALVFVLTLGLILRGTGEGAGRAAG